MAPDKDTGFTDDERAAIKERARELKAEAKADRKRADGERDVLEKIDEMPEADRALAERVHAVVSDAAPDLAPRTWYGMPAYARDGKVVCFFQSAAKFKARYATLGFSDQARLDDGALWPTSFALVEWTDDVEAAVTDLVRRASG
ncbi:iron chaperone [Rubrivirga marina]|uniref:YdhG-like domain-containing protein n=1 Tax=Rubrivirga marina TaxID=1196024 RepID=A0A271IXW8_9BACT|nr:DUF1801 domain-containing protein [Rubrivirga marina]PAP76101.1 hypothetical protein BSZ37_06405 [Rubrivirga marina]